MAIFYHISTDLFHNGVFEPRIPECRHQQAEDSITPRIAVAPTIENCLTAIPGGGGNFEDLIAINRGYFLVFKIDTEALGIQDADIIDSDTLYKNDTVRDAYWTSEHWITKPFVVPPENRFIINVESWNEEPFDVVPYSILQIADKDYDGDYVRAYETEMQEFTPCSVEITNLVYKGETIERDTEVTLRYDFDDEKLYLIEALKRKFSVKSIRDFTDQLLVVFNKEACLRQIYLEHARMIC